MSRGPGFGGVVRMGDLDFKDRAYWCCEDCGHPLAQGPVLFEETLCTLAEHQQKTGCGSEASASL